METVSGRRCKKKKNMRGESGLLDGHNQSECLRLAGVTTLAGVDGFEQLSPGM